jgi:hypothetical protein
MVDGLIIRSSSIHAAGCYTTRKVKKGERVCEYDGPRFSKDVADERYADRDITYLFSCGDDGTVIDGFIPAIRTASRMPSMAACLLLRSVILPRVRS